MQKQIEKGRARTPSSKLFDRVNQILKPRPNSTSRTATPLVSSKSLRTLNTTIGGNSHAKLKLFEKFSRAWRQPSSNAVEAELFVLKLQLPLQSSLAVAVRRVCKVVSPRKSRHTMTLGKAKCSACGHVGLGQLTSSTKENLSPRFTEHLSMLFFNEKLLKTQHFEANFASSVAPTETKASACFVKQYDADIDLSIMLEEPYDYRKISGFHDISFISRKSDINESPEAFTPKDKYSIKAQDTDVVNKRLRNDLSIDFDKDCSELPRNFSMLLETSHKGCSAKDRRLLNYSESPLESPEEKRVFRRLKTTAPEPSKLRDYSRIAKFT